MNTKLDKSMFWKTGTVFVPFIVARILSMVVLALIVDIYFVNQTNGLSGLLAIEGTYLWYVVMFLVLVAQLVGLRYGVKAVARKAVILNNDVSKIIILQSNSFSRSS